MKPLFPQFIKLGLLISGLALFLYWLDDFYFAPKRVPACQQDKLPEGRICLSTALDKWAGKVVWIDARSEADFEVNRLSFADNRMFQIQPGEKMKQQIDAAIARLFEAAEKQECIVIFCTKDCHKAEDVAQELKTLQLDVPIYVLEGGWDAIRHDGSLLP